ncbi:hypothetical protein [Pseudomonas plecoglossicida]
MKERKKQKVLIDTGVLLEHPDIITSIRDKGHWPVLLAEALTTLIERRSQPTSHGRHAERVLSQIEGGKAYAIKRFPTGDTLRDCDHLAEFRYDGAPAFLFKRQRSTQQSGVGGLIEIASQYGMTVVTRDDQVVKLAADAKVLCYKWPLEEKLNAPRHVSEPPPPPPSPPAPVPLKLIPFKLYTTPLCSADVELSVRALPGANESVVIPGGKEIRLGQKINAGGEGVIYETDAPGMVCKIYHSDKLTSLKRQKIELMVSRKIDRVGICWPAELVLNKHGEFVGYLMPRADGKTMQASMVVKAVLLKNFPNWQRIDLVNLCLAFLEQVRYLHSLNILVGDINPQNLLITQDSKRLWLVDTDSFQVEGFPCPVGTVTFTAPEIQGQAYGNFLRSMQHELFAVATMLFMILLPGKPPYSQLGGGSTVENIKAKKFPYRDFNDKENFSGENAPHGSWGIIWNHLSRDLRSAFHRTFSRDDRLTLNEWISLLERYRFSIKKNWCGNEIFPTSYFFIRDPIEVECGRCKSKTTASQKYAQAQAKKGMKVWCQDCFKQNKLTRMADESLKDKLEAEKKYQGRPATVQAVTRAALGQQVVRPSSGNQGSRTAAAAHSSSGHQGARPTAAPRPAPAAVPAASQSAATRPAVAPAQRDHPQPQSTPTPKRHPPIFAPRHAQPKPVAQPPIVLRVARLLRKLWISIFFK